MNGSVALCSDSQNYTKTYVATDLQTNNNLRIPGQRNNPLYVTTDVNQRMFTIATTVAEFES